MHEAPQRVVVIGGGFGGLRTALHLAKRRAYDVVLIDRSDVHVYTPWLYEIASGRTDHASATSERVLRHSAGIPLKRIVDGTGIRLRIASVVGVDVAHRHVVFADGTTVGYDALVIAAGSETAYFGIPGLEEHALTIKSVADTQRVHACMTSVLRAVKRGESAHVMVGGAGPSGAELVGELATMVRARVRRGALPAGKVQFTLVDAASSLFPTYPPAVARKTERRFRAIGVQMLLDTMVTKVTDHHVTLTPRPPKDAVPSHAPLHAATEVPVSCFVWCGGVTPSKLTAALPLPKDARGRITTDATFEVTGTVNIFALGDIAVFASPNAVPLPQTAQAADEVSGAVALNVVRALARRALVPYVPPKTWPFVVAIGGRYGVGYLWGMCVSGFFAYAIRRAADLRYLFRILPPVAAYRVWRSRMRLYAEND